MINSTIEEDIPTTRILPTRNVRSSDPLTPTARIRNTNALRQERSINTNGLYSQFLCYRPTNLVGDTVLEMNRVKEKEETNESDIKNHKSGENSKVEAKVSFDEEIEETAKNSDPSFEELTGGLPPASAEDSEYTLFFEDKKRRIDLVLVYDEEDFTKGVLMENETLRIHYRERFHKSLEDVGLQLEIEPKENSYDGRKIFVKIHLPYDALIKYSNRWHIRKPIKEGEEKDEEDGYFQSFLNWFKLDDPELNEEPNQDTSIFGDESEEQFLVKYRQNYFTSAQRSLIVWKILLRAKFGDNNDECGIRRLLNNHTYLSAFPLHEGPYDKTTNVLYDRRRLHMEWARPGRWYKRQPLWLIKKYYGDKIALYFAWLGFYTKMLILPSIVGLCCFLYGYFTRNSSKNKPSEEICNPNTAGNITLCSMYDGFYTKLQKLGDSCLFSKLTYLSDNNATVFIAIFMSFWATLFLEMWKRKQSIIAWQWDFHSGIEDDETRPEFEASIGKYRINPVTRKKEPFMPAWSKIYLLSLSLGTVVFMVLIVVMAVISVIIFRLELTIALIESTDIEYIRKHIKMITSAASALVNLLIIVCLTKLYRHIAIWLTNKENPRTQSDYEKSVTFKIFLFEFMNYYSSLIYIAFFKGRFFGHPGQEIVRTLWVTRLKEDICDPAGCLSELCIQLSIIMVGKQFFNNVLELLFPAVKNWWRARSHRNATTDRTRSSTHWEKNYDLQDPGRLALFDEYLEMAIQYGFVTLFVAGFPLAPLFALLNNIVEIQLDAYKINSQARRPLAERARDIGAWSSVLTTITYCAVIFNAFVIAYTSDFIPRIVYQFYYSENRTLEGYIDWSLSVFNTTDYAKPIPGQPEICRYRGFRNGPDHEKKYELSFAYWNVQVARLLFVVIFEHLVFVITAIISKAIPNVPRQVERQMQLEKILFEEHKRDCDNVEGDDYDDFLLLIRDVDDPSKISRVIKKEFWARRNRSSVVNIRKTDHISSRKSCDDTTNVEEIHHIS